MSLGFELIFVRRGLSHDFVIFNLLWEWIVCLDAIFREQGELVLEYMKGNPAKEDIEIRRESFFILIQI